MLISKYTKKPYIIYQRANGYNVCQFSSFKVYCSRKIPVSVYIAKTLVVLCAKHVNSIMVILLNLEGFRREQVVKIKVQAL